MGHDPRALARNFASRPLFIHESYLDALMSGWIAPVDVDLEKAEAAARRPVQSSGGTAVINLMGPLQQRADMFMMFFGGTSTEGFRSQINAALNDDAIRSIVLNVDSPGGTVDGTEEAASALFAARGRKPITAVANTMAASAAYYIASQADELVVTPSGQVGSIGVVMLHRDVSQAMESQGVRTTVIRSGKYKIEANPFEPLTEDAREHLQSMSDHWYGQFVSAVARGRNASEAEVRNGYGQGRMAVASDAVRMGLADRVATLEQVLSRHGGGSSGARAEIDQERLARLWELARA